MERHGGQSSNRRILQRRVWPLCEAEVLRPADVSRRVYVRRRRRRETGVRHWMACRGSLAEYSAFLVCALRQGYDVAVRRTISPAWHSGCTWIRCSEEVNDQSRLSPVLRRSTEKMPSRIRQGRGPPFLSYCSFSRQLEACGSSSKSDVLQIFPPTISDHGLVMATIPYPHDAPSTFTRLIRGWRGLDRERFRAALMEVPVVADPSTAADLSAEAAFLQYKTSMSQLVDRFLPLRLITIRRCPHSPWFDRECRSMRRQASRHERKYRRTGLPSDRLTWVQFVRYMHRKYREKEGTYWEDRISSHTKEPKRLWTTFNALLGRRRGSAGHSSEESSFTADDFLASYTAKILGVRRATENASAPHHPTTDCCLPTVNEVTTEEVRRLIITSPPKSCELDPIPTFLLQELLDVLLPLFTMLCNRSIRDGVLPSSQKRSILLPVLKGDGLDAANPVNYRPIANVSFVSKIIEKIVACQLIAYLDRNNLLPPCQPGFRKFHSTETLLLRLLSDIYGAIDRSDIVSFIRRKRRF